MSLRIDASGEYCDVADNAAFDTTTYLTLECWVYLTSSSPSSEELMDKTDHYGMRINIGGNLQGTLRTVGGGAQSSQAGSGESWIVGWNHLAFCYDDNANVATGYVNGSRVINDTTTWPTGTNLAITDAGGNAFQVGGSNNNMLISEMRISNSVRYTGASFSVPTERFAPDANTIALWHFDENTGSTVNDSSTNGLDMSFGATAPDWLATNPFNIIYYVDTDVVGGNDDGTTWANAWGGIEDARTNITNLTGDCIVYFRGAANDTTLTTFWDIAAITNIGTYTLTLQGENATTGVWDTSRYTIEETNSGGSRQIRPDDGFRMYDIQMYNNGARNNYRAINGVAAATDVIIARNIFRCTASPGTTTAAAGNGGSSDAYIYENNVIYGPWGHGVFSRGSGTIVRKNTIYGCDYGVRRRDNLTIDGNLIFGSGTAWAEYISGTQTITNNVCDEDLTGIDASNTYTTQTDTQLVTNVTSGTEDFNLVSGSDAIDNGTNDGAPTDIAGYIRGADQDGGAFELGTGAYIVDPDAVGSPARHYSAIETALQTEARNLVTATDTDTFQIRNSAGGDAVGTDGDLSAGSWTTSSTYYVTIEAYTGYEWTGQNFDTTKAWLNNDTATDWHAMGFGNNGQHFHFKNVQIQREGVADGAMMGTASGSNHYFDSCLFDGPTSGEGPRWLALAASATTLYAYNCLFTNYWNASNGIMNWWYTGAVTLNGEIYNCTIVGNTTDHLVDFTETATRTFPDIKNLYLNNQGSGADFQDTDSASYTAVDVYTSDATSPTSDNNISANFKAGSWKLANGDSMAGTDLSGESPSFGIDFTVDVEGQPRSSWHVGMDEFYLALRLRRQVGLFYG